MKFSEYRIRQFVTLARTTTDTPILIQRVAENRFFLDCCAAIVKTDDTQSPFLDELCRSLKTAAEKQALSFTDFQKKLTPVAGALGLLRPVAGAIQTDYYQVLGISPSATAQEIKFAHRKMVRACHPDTGSDDNDLFVRVQEAYEVLSSKSLRRQYDVSRNTTDNWKWQEGSKPQTDRKATSFSRTRPIATFVIIILFLAVMTVIVDTVNQDFSLTSRSTPHADNLPGQAQSMKPDIDTPENTPPFRAKTPEIYIPETGIVEESPEEKILTFPAITSHKSPPVKIFEKTPKPAPATKIKENRAKTAGFRQEAIASDSRNKPPSTHPTYRDMGQRLYHFLQQYCSTYENRDLDRFAGFFADTAEENGVLFTSLLPAYQNNFNLLEEIHYRVDMTGYSWEVGTDRVQLEGNFKLSWRKKQDTVFHTFNGQILMDLIFEKESLLVSNLSYHFTP